jgi:YegS/Rv2252/BmrU family lipid kinase
MTSIAVVAHARKQLGDGLPALRRLLERRGFDTPIWHEVQKSKQAPKRVEKALAAGADLVFVWGGDGTVQRCIDVMAGTDATLAILPAGTANLLANNLGIPADLEAAVDIGLHGARRRLDTGTVNGEHFAVMAGCGLDARMIGDADRSLKDRWGRAAYVWTGARNLRATAVRGTIRIDGELWFSGDLSCVLVGNVGSLFGGMTVFEDARPDDGRLDVGVVTATGVTAWLRAFGRLATGSPERSPFVRTTVARRIDVRLDHSLLYELDGGARSETRKLKIKVRPGSMSVAVPAP